MLQNTISVLQMITSPMTECGGLLFLLAEHVIEQTVKRLVIGNIKTLMWRHCNNNAISVLQMTTSPVRECGCFLCYKQGHTVEQQSSG